jgi:hypothetical protein
LYAQVSLNVRKYPDKDAEKLFALPVNAEVMVTAECENGWVEITYGEKNGYCNGVYLGENPVMMPEVMEVSGNVEETKSEYSCLIRGNCSDTEWNRFVAAWNAIPDGWKNEINNSGWQIICTNDDFWTARGYSILDGLTRYNEKYTYIRACGGRVDVVVPHEVGHIVDCYYGFPSLSEEFVGLFEAESSGFEEYKNETSQSKTNSTEYFAIIWLQILLAPSTESSAPNSFAFVRQYF